MEVTCPDNAEVFIEGKKIIVKGPKGELERDFNDPRFNSKISFKVENKKIIVEALDKNKTIHAMVGTISAHIKNMLKGVTDGFEYKMKIISTHFPMKKKKKGNELLIKNFLGSKSYRRAKIVADTKVKIDKQVITATGVNKEHVSQTCANIENATRVTKWDRRIFIDGIFMVK